MAGKLSIGCELGLVFGTIRGCACHPSAGARPVFSVWFQRYYTSCRSKHPFNTLNGWKKEKGGGYFVTREVYVKPSFRCPPTTFWANAAASLLCTASLAALGLPQRVVETEGVCGTLSLLAALVEEDAGGQQKGAPCRNPGLNQGPLDLQSNALPTELFRPPGRRGRGAALLAFLFQEVGFNGGWLGFGFPTCGGPARSSRTPAGRKGLDCVLGACCSHPVPDRGGGQVEDRDGRDVPGIRWKTWPAPRHPAS